MPADEEVQQRVAIALAQAKKVERESRYLKQMLGGLSESLQPKEAQAHDSNTQDSR